MFRLLIPLERHPQFPDEAKKKWPRHFMVARAPIFGPKGFYMMQLPKSHKKLTILLIVGVLIVIAFMLFSIWPLWLKIGIWYVSFYTLIFLLGLIIVRFFVWLFLFHFGLDFWLFPNLFIDSVRNYETLQFAYRMTS